MYKNIKKLIDIVCSFLGLLLFSPLLFSVMLFIYFTVGRPIFFRQQRAGINGVPFRIVKFRTMTNCVDASGRLLPDNERLFKLGKFLRASSIDELPALYNVLAGQMSLVGPRPLHLRYVSRYDSNQIRRLSVLPGITGWAQVNGRNAISWDMKFFYDIWYVDHISFKLDIKILLLTFLRLFNFSNVNSSGEETMPEFLGKDG